MCNINFATIKIYHSLHYPIANDYAPKQVPSRSPHGGYEAARDLLNSGYLLIPAWKNHQ